MNITAQLSSPDSQRASRAREYGKREPLGPLLQNQQIPFEPLKTGANSPQSKGEVSACARESHRTSGASGLCVGEISEQKPAVPWHYFRSIWGVSSFALIFECLFKNVTENGFQMDPNLSVK